MYADIRSLNLIICVFEISMYHIYIIYQQILRSLRFEIFVSMIFDPFFKNVIITSEHQKLLIEELLSKIVR